MDNEEGTALRLLLDTHFSIYSKVDLIYHLPSPALLVSDLWESRYQRAAVCIVCGQYLKTVQDQPTVLGGVQCPC